MAKVIKFVAFRVFIFLDGNNKFESRNKNNDEGYGFEASDDDIEDPLTSKDIEFLRRSTTNQKSRKCIPQISGQASLNFLSGQLVVEKKNSCIAFSEIKNGESIHNIESTESDIRAFQKAFDKGEISFNDVPEGLNFIPSSLSSSIRRPQASHDVPITGKPRNSLNNNIHFNDNNEIIGPTSPREFAADKSTSRLRPLSMMQHQTISKNNVTEQIENTENALNMNYLNNNNNISTNKRIRLLPTGHPDHNMNSNRNDHFNSNNVFLNTINKAQNEDPIPRPPPPPVAFREVVRGRANRERLSTVIACHQCMAFFKEVCPSSLPPSARCSHKVSSSQHHAENGASAPNIGALLKSTGKHRQSVPVATCGEKDVNTNDINNFCADTPLSFWRLEDFDSGSSSSSAESSNKVSSRPPSFSSKIGDLTTNKNRMSGIIGVNEENERNMQEKHDFQDSVNGNELMQSSGVHLINQPVRKHLNKSKENVLCKVEQNINNMNTHYGVEQVQTESQEKRAEESGSQDLLENIENDVILEMQKQIRIESKNRTRMNKPKKTDVINKDAVIILKDSIRTVNAPSVQSSSSLQINGQVTQHSYDPMTFSEDAQRVSPLWIRTLMGSEDLEGGDSPYYD